jgi:mono/diheme cytochrome c family protein
MPSWGEFLPEGQRWDILRYVVDAFFVGRPQAASVDDGRIAPQFVTLSQDNWVGAGNVISVTNGADLYATYCTTCHGDKGQGSGPGTAETPSGSPAPLPDNMETAYIFWRIWEGVPDGVMGPFNWILSEEDIWDITTYVESLFPSGGGQ